MKKPPERTSDFIIGVRRRLASQVARKTEMLYQKDGLAAALNYLQGFFTYPIDERSFSVLSFNCGDTLGCLDLSDSRRAAFVRYRASSETADGTGDCVVRWIGSDTETVERSLNFIRLAS